MIEIQKFLEIKHGCPKQTDADCKELMNVNMWEATKCILTCRLFENLPENNRRHIWQIVTD